MNLDMSSLRASTFTTEQLESLQWESSQETPDRRDWTSLYEGTGGTIQRQSYMDSIQMGRAADTYNDSLKKEVIEQTNYQFGKLHAEINNLKSYISSMAQNNDAMKARIDELENNNYTQSLLCKDLEEKVESYESHDKNSVVEIKNVPAKDVEIKYDLVLLVRIIGKALELNILSCEIYDIYRIHVINNNHPYIIVKFSSIPLKEEFIKRGRKISKDNPLGIGSVLGMLGYAVTQVTICQHLTSKQRRLFSLANEFANTYGYYACWCLYGKVYLRKVDGASHIHVRNEAHLESLKYY